MWRDEVGITEMLLSYLGEFLEFRSWSSWREVVIDILTCHEETRRCRGNSINVGNQVIFQSMVKDNRVIDPLQVESNQAWECSEKIDYQENVGIGMSASEIKLEQCSEEYPITEADVGSEILEIDKLENAVDGQTSVVPEISQHKAQQFGCEQDHTDVFSHFDGSDEYCIGEGVHTTDVNGDTSYHATTITPSNFSGGKNLKQSAIPANSGTGETSYKCSLCDQRFINKWRLARHRKLHSGLSTSQCSFCLKVFSCPSHRKSHERIHTGEKPFVCSYCPMRFNQDSTRKTHEIVHTGEKPYACSFCGLLFKGRASRMRHQRTHIGVKEQIS